MFGWALRHACEDANEKQKDGLRMENTFLKVQLADAKADADALRQEMEYRNEQNTELIRQLDREKLRRSLVNADYSELERYVVAHYEQDPAITYEIQRQALQDALRKCSKTYRGIVRPRYVVKHKGPYAGASYQYDVHDTYEGTPVAFFGSRTVAGVTAEDRARQHCKFLNSLEM